MKYFLIFLLFGASGLPAAIAQDKIYRCGSEYINNSVEAQARGCKLMEGGNISIISVPKSAASGALQGRVNGASTATPRVVSSEQRARDSDARAILESELRKLEAKQAELLKEFNNGEPEKQGIEARNQQRYLDRVAEIKANIARGDSDIAGLRRELGRLPASK